MKILIIGFGAAGETAAETVRRTDRTASITVLNGEPWPFYLRLDLEAVFTGKPLEALMPRPAEFFQEKNIEIVADCARNLDTTRQIVTSRTGREWPYDRLLIATGSKPRRLNIPGEDLDGVHSYHTLTDARTILAGRNSVKRAVIIGGGILGLELARIASLEFGWDTTVIVRRDVVGAPLTEPRAAEQIRRAMAGAGVKIIFNDEARAFEGEEGHLTRLMTAQGRTLDADFAAVCIGIQPASDWLEGSGVLTDGRLVVDETLATPVPRVFAAGDVCQVRRPDGRFVACHTWMVAASQARVVGGNLIGGQAQWKDDVPFNLDALFGIEFAMIGAWEERHEPGHVIHEMPEGNVYRAVATRDGILVAAFLLGSREGDKRIRRLISDRVSINGKLDLVFAPDTKPEDFAA
jgi:NAD(P)H-nitrite reductase large subunit